MSRQSLIFFALLLLILGALLVYHLNTDSPYNSEVFFGKEQTHKTGKQPRKNASNG